MSESKVNMSIINAECPEFLEKAVTPPAQEIGRTLSNIFYTIFYPINYNVDKLRKKTEINLKKYEEDIKSEINKIPEEKLTEPKISIVGPSLEASKYYIDNSEIRKMFAKLISSSMNVDTYDIVHPSFVEIIKQLSPLDASNFKSISLPNSQPIAKYRVLQKDEISGLDVKTNIYLSNPEYNNPSTSEVDLISSSISNLVRLGLVSISYTTHFVDESVYEKFKEFHLFNDIEEELRVNLLKNNNYPYKTVSITKGIIQITPFGLNFAKICL